MPDPQTLGQIVTEITADGPVISQPLPEDPAARQAFKDRFSAVAEAARLVAEQTGAAAHTPAPDPGDGPAEEPPPPPVALDQIAYLVRRRAELTLQISSTTAARDEIDTAIQDALGQARVGTVAGRVVVHWSSGRPNRLNQHRLKTEYPDAYKACLEKAATPERRFTLDAVAALAATREVTA